MSRRAAAEATLDGQVNDWVDAARSRARDVIELCVEADAEAAAHRREIEAAHVDLAAAAVRVDEAVAAAEHAQAAAEEARSEAVELAVQLKAWRMAAVNLNAKIVEHADNQFTFAYGSRGVIKAFRKRIGV